MSENLSSAALLRENWAKFALRYFQQLGRKPSKRELSKQLAFDVSALSKWMDLDGPKNRRIPVEHVAVVATALMLSPKEADQLMTTRITELARDDKSVKAALTWVLERNKSSMVMRRLLTEEELHVLAAFQLASESFPRGLYRDAEESSLMVAQMHVLLERAQGLATEEDSLDRDLKIDTRSMTDKLMAMLAKRKKEAPPPLTAARQAAQALRKPKPAQTS
jgi:hypothetical protein